ncbi:glycosyltransferase family 2 protein [Priestia megaterium]|uniref:glycosyltransferase family 2 protein n=1 Tax=Priestia megaterium TaxID=1404 RepID=UPI003879C272
MKPLVSCIITTYKRPIKVLKRAITSIISQTYSNIEIIVVNDYPKDSQLVKSISDMISSIQDKRISYIVHEQNLGGCAARNTGVLASNGEYIAFLDDDDEWMPQKIERQLNLFDNNQVGLVYCQYFRVEKNRTIKIVPRDFCKEALKEIYCYNFIGGNSFPLIRKTAILEAGLFDVNLKSSQDTDMWIRILEKNYKIRYCKESLVKYYISEEAISTDINKIKEGYLYLLKKYKHVYESDKQLYIKKLNMIAVALFVHGAKGDGLKYWRKALMTQTLSINNLLFAKKLCGYLVMNLRRNN